MIVHQVLGSASPHDAVTEEAREYRLRFRSWGWAGSDFAPRIAPGIRDIQALGGFQPAPEDVLLIHYSASMPQLDQVMSHPNPKLLVYHNITPAHYLWNDAPLVAAHCAVGRAQLRGVVHGVDKTAAHSGFTAAELADLGAKRTETIPILVSLERLGPARDEPPLPTDQPTVLSVGRLSPHKRHDELIRAFAAYRKYRSPHAQLVLIGGRLTAAYSAVLSDLAAALAPGGVTIESGLADGALGERYRGATVFVSLSEHEGFCVPLLEAFYMGIPVIARPSGAVAEVAGDAAVLLDDRDPAVIAETIHLVASDRDLRGELVRRGRERLHTFANERIESRLRATVEETAAARS